jgi:hypothetical protein
VSRKNVIVYAIGEQTALTVARVKWEQPSGGTVSSNVRFDAVLYLSAPCAGPGLLPLSEAGAVGVSQGVD